MLTICLMRRSHSQKPMIVSMRSSRRKILSTVVLISYGGVELVERPARLRDDPRQPRARLAFADTSPRTRSSRRCPCTAPAADSTRARRLAGRAPRGSRASARLAPTPPATTSRVEARRLERLPALARQRVDDGGLKRRRDVGAHARPAMRRRRRGTASIVNRAAVFKPLKLMSSPWFFSGRGSAKRRASPRSAKRRELRPARDTAGRAAARPCRTPRRPRRRASRR